MVVRIELRCGESIHQALYRFRKMVFWARKRKSHKTRPGVFEKPSIRHRRREGLELLNARLAEYHGPGSTNNNIGVAGLFAREDTSQPIRPRFADRDPRDEDWHGHEEFP